MKDKIILKGITWNHSRGFCPMVATGQRFMETHDHVNVEWKKRTLQQFADQHIEDLAKEYDLLVIDHPWAGYAADTGVIIPLNKYIPKAFLQDQELNSVGKSYESYQFGGNQYGLPIDAATPVASSRPDILKKNNLELPKTFEDLLVLAEKGWVTMPGIPIDTLMNFYMFCGALGEDPFQSSEQVVSENVGSKALELFKELTDRLNPEHFNWNPIKVYEAMASRSDLAYCPWAYGYANYAREGYAEHILLFHDLIDYNSKVAFRSTLGGTGLAISAHCKHKELAVEYAMQVMSPRIQQTLYFENGGQPGHRGSWVNEQVNHLSADFFKNTLKTLDNAFLRPRYNGYLYFQDHAGDPIRNYLMSGGNKLDVLAAINKLYKESQTLDK